ncbi:hypothetical protein HYT56_03935 [Candidatus Woesearchaeota archaeon]|nr:hypothetical protein [Candidatus Woesearchaeota archaeon]
MEKRSAAVIITVIFCLLVVALIGEYTGFFAYEYPEDNQIKKPNIKVSVPEEFKRVHPGDDIEFTIVFYEFQDPQDVNVSYNLKKINGDLIYSLIEETYLSEETLKTRKVKLPSDAEIGAYVFSARILDSTSISSDFFEVEKTFIPKKVGILTLTWIVIALIALVFAIIIKLNWSAISRFKRLKWELFWWNFKWKLKERKYYLTVILIILALIMGLLIILLIT